MPKPVARNVGSISWRNPKRFSPSADFSAAPSAEGPSATPSSSRVWKKSGADHLLQAEVRNRAPPLRPQVRKNPDASIALRPRPLRPWLDLQVRPSPQPQTRTSSKACRQAAVQTQRLKRHTPGIRRRRFSAPKMNRAPIRAQQSQGGRRGRRAMSQQVRPQLLFKISMVRTVALSTNSPNRPSAQPLAEPRLSGADLQRILKGGCRPPP